MRLMRTRKRQDAPRRAILSEAVKALRGRLDLSQAKFAQTADIDAGTVSRWERGDLSPTQRKCEALAVLARKKGMLDIAAIFLAPVENWRTLLRDAEPAAMNRIAELEIIAVNSYCLTEDENAQPLFQELDRVVDALTKLLLKHVAGDEEIRLWDAAHQTLWLEILERHGLKKKREMTTAQRKRALVQVEKLGRELSESIFKKVKADGEEGKTR
jgi:DNA-binding transcriptional regulator YiaG